MPYLNLNRNNLLKYIYIIYFFYTKPQTLKNIAQKNEQSGRKLSQKK